MGRAMLIAPSVLTADFARLGQEVEALEAAGVDKIHWDVMDGCFVPNLTMGPDIVAAARRHTRLPFEAHLMVAEPEVLLSRWVDAGCELVTVHAEACRHLHRTLGAVRDLGVRAGVALNPATPPSAIDHVIDLVDLVLVMTVNPGFGGQKHLSTMVPKVAAVAASVAETGREIEIEVDGGIAADTVSAPLAAGATTFVVGSALYRHPGGIGEAVGEIRRRMEEATGALRRPRVCA